MSKEEDIWCLEEAFHSKDRKASRKERKIITNKDRSQFKKTDQDQKKKHLELQSDEDTAHLRTGRVLAVLPEGVIVALEDNEQFCTLKGTLKQEKSRVKNLIAVGDFVKVEEGKEATIVKVEPRHSILSRADNLSRNKEQLIAVNIDQVLITASVVLPPLKPALIDRYIIAALKGNMEPILVINKIDLLQTPPPEIDPVFFEKQKELYAEFLAAYETLGFKIVPVSIVTGEGIETLKKWMSGKTSVFSGQSGVGKSSLINCMTGTDLATGGLVYHTRKGSHTTTTTHLVPLEKGGFCIDTPGIKSFGVWELEVSDFATGYPEIQSVASQCKYPDCAHMNEPECAVKAAVEKGEISSLRFHSYCALMSSLSEKHRLR